jgi:enoyl-[acyl-carrier protein] reductase III
VSKFAGKVALVTGSGRGIGRSIALRFAEEGADVVVNFYRNRVPAEECADTIRELGRRALVVKANVGNLDDLLRLFSETDTAFGRLDFLVHNAASGFNRPVMEQKPRGWEWTVNINARALLFGAQQAVPLMQRAGGGAIVAISSIGSVRVMPDYVVVGSSKAAMESLVRYLGVELAPMNIRVNGVSPGVVITEALQYFQMFDEGATSLTDRVRALTPAGRLCLPSDVAEMVMFLCSPQAGMLCGQILVLDGGHSLLMAS